VNEGSEATANEGESRRPPKGASNEEKKRATREALERRIKSLAFQKKAKKYERLDGGAQNEKSKIEGVRRYRGGWLGGRCGEGRERSLKWRRRKTGQGSDG